MMLPSRLGCPLSLKTPNMGNTGYILAGAKECRNLQLNNPCEEVHRWHAPIDTEILPWTRLASFR